MLIVSVIAVGYLAIGVLIAWVINSSFQIGTPADAAAGSSPSLSKWIALPGIALFWPLAILIPLIALFSWTNNGSH
jgi:hypothetical protein